MLVIWLIAGIPLSFIMLPYLAVKTAKTIISSKINKEIGFLNARSIKEIPDKLSGLATTSVIIASVLTLPITMPIVFIGVLLYLTVIAVIATLPLNNKIHIET